MYIYAIETQNKKLKLNKPGGLKSLIINKMNAKARNTDIIRELNYLKELFPFGIKHKHIFIEVKYISIDISGKLFYLNNNNLKSVSSLIKQIKVLKTVRWLNHLYFIDGLGKEQNFKKYVSQKYNLNFT